MGGQRICPTYQQRNCPGAPDPVMSSCEKGLKVKPRKGSVILWYNFHPSGRGDRNALHAGCPVGKGLEKWSGNKWVHIKPLHSPPAKWNPKHPVLKRMNWKGKHGGDPNACKIAFLNRASFAVDTIWLSPDGSDAALGKIEPGQT